MFIFRDATCFLTATMIAILLGISAAAVPASACTITRGATIHDPLEALDAAVSGDNWGLPMTFSIAGQGVATYIYADGDFMRDTAERFESFFTANQIPSHATVVLNSRGGALGAGMRLGEAIRAHHLRTLVGAKKNVCHDTGAFQAPYSGYCISACSLAFLGGETRDVVREGIYAVHQFSLHDCRDPQSGSEVACPTWQAALSLGQVTAGEIVTYVERMGVDAGLLKLMVEATPDRHNSLTYLQLVQYRIVFNPSEVSWVIVTTDDGEFALEATKTTQWKTNRVRFRCGHEGTPHLMIDWTYDTHAAGGQEDAARIIGLTAKGLEFQWDTRSGAREALVLSDDEIVQPPHRLDDGEIGFTIAVSPRLNSAFLMGTGFDITTVASDDSNRFGYGFAFGGGMLDPLPIEHKRMDGFFGACR